MSALFPNAKKTSKRVALCKFTHPNLLAGRQQQIQINYSKTILHQKKIQNYTYLADPSNRHYFTRLSGQWIKFYISWDYILTISPHTANTCQITHLPNLHRRNPPEPAQCSRPAREEARAGGRFTWRGYMETPTRPGSGRHTGKLCIR